MPCSASTRTPAGSPDRSWNPAATAAPTPHAVGTVAVDVAGATAAGRAVGSLAVVSADNVTHFPSIQQEQQATTGSGRAAEVDVDSYVDRVSQQVLTCRQRGRHLWPAMRVQDQPFTAIDGDGLFIRRLTCTCCELAVRVEKWAGSKRGRRARFELVESRLEYLTGSEGETYRAPSGSGRMTPRQIADSVASKAMQGQSLVALRKSLPRA